MLKNEKKILWISFYTGLCFAILEFSMAIYTHSQSVLMDAAYDASELIIVGLTLALTPLFYKPITEHRPFGYMQVESVFVVVKSCMLLSVTIGLSANSIEIALSGGNKLSGGKIAIFQFVLSIISLSVLLIMKRINKSANSPIINAELYGWKIDALSSLVMSGVFFISTLLEGTIFDPILPYFDQIVMIIVVFLMLPECFQILRQSTKSVFLFAPDKEIIDTVKSITIPIIEQTEYKVVFFDIVQIGRRLWVAIYFESPHDMVSISNIKAVSAHLSNAINNELGDCSCELIPMTSPF